MSAKHEPSSRTQQQNYTNEISADAKLKPNEAIWLWAYNALLLPDELGSGDRFRGGGARSRRADSSTPDTQATPSLIE